LTPPAADPIAGGPPVDPAAAPLFDPGAPAGTPARAEDADPTRAAEGALQRAVRELWEKDFAPRILTAAPRSGGEPAQELNREEVIREFRAAADKLAKEWPARRDAEVKRFTTLLRQLVKEGRFDEAKRLYQDLSSVKDAALTAALKELARTHPDLFGAALERNPAARVGQPAASRQPPGRPGAAGRPAAPSAVQEMTSGFSGPQIEDPAAQAADTRTAQMLHNPVKGVDLKNQTLRSALEYFADAAKVDVFADWKSFERAGIDPETPVNLRLKEAASAEQLLRWILRAAGEQGGFAIDHGVVLVATREDLAKLTVTRVYDISSLKHREGQTLPRLVMDFVEPDSWRDAGGSVGVVREFGDKLLITQTEPNHREVEKLLQLLAQKGDSNSARTDTPEAPK
jgi:pentatricopeptide repeat protein